MKALIILGFAALLALANTGELCAQTTRNLSAAARRLDDFNQQSDKAAREEMAREMARRKPTKEELRKAAQIKAETKEDLESLQESYNAIVLKLSEKIELPPAFVVEASAKIHKHASRLRDNIVFPKTEKEQVVFGSAAAPKSTRGELKEMCAQIYQFLTNPMIENPSVLDLETAAKAGLALKSILDSSERLKGTANQ